jgi:hypothetical protein
LKKKSDAKIFLEQVEKLDNLIECKQIEKQQWHDLALSITASMGGERVQSSGSQSKMADAVTKCVAMEDEIARVIDTLIATKSEVVHTIEQVDNPTWYKLLHMKYIQHLELITIADNLNSSYDWAKSTHGRAVKAVQDILEK